MNFDFLFGAVSKVWERMNGPFKSHLIDECEANSKRFLRIKPWHVENFFKIIDDDLAQFFKYDKCYRMADNYLIAIVFVYFIRGDLEVEEYTPLNFLTALHLALAMEEDDDELLKDLQTWLDTIDETPDILERQKTLFQRVGYRGSVSRSCCETVMQKINPNHIIWQRQRHINHSGALSDYQRRKTICPRCI